MRGHAKIARERKDCEGTQYLCVPSQTYCMATQKKNNLMSSQYRRNELFGGKIIPLKYIVEQTALTVLLYSLHIARSNKNTLDAL